MKHNFKQRFQVCETVMFERNYHIRATPSRLKPIFANDSGEPIGKTLCGLDAVRDTSVPLNDYGHENQYKQKYCFGCIELAIVTTDVVGRKDLKKWTK